MSEPKIVTRVESSAFEEKLIELVETCRGRGESQKLMVAMAAVMQRELCKPDAGTQLPHAGALDPIMRAVEHALRGDPEMARYVHQKLAAGQACLQLWFPDPAQHEA